MTYVGTVYLEKILHFYEDLINSACVFADFISLCTELVLELVFEKIRPRVILPGAP